MAVNQSHTENRRGAFIPSSDSVLMQSQDVDLSFPQQPERSSLFSGTKRGTLFLTSYRVIFVTSHLVSDPMFSFMMPFDLMSNCTVEQPVFAANYIKGTIQAAPDGGWEGQATFKLAFRKGGAIEFAQLMVKAASAAARGVPLGSASYWFSPPGLLVVTGQGNMCALNRCLVQHTHLLSMDPHRQDMDPHRQDMDPHRLDMDPHRWNMDTCHGDTDPHQQDTDPHLWDLEPHQEHTEPCLWDTEPSQPETKPYRLEVKTQGLEIKPHLQDMKFHLLELELGLANLWQSNLLGMRLLFPLPHLLRAIHHLPGIKP
uniref:LOW QUALITY PROTEIN: postacrosomal sheath WW domain-binding protein n=1 Tax=Panthera onca TaxID=9690 RepID=UPI002954AA43|nr:LOW QUALITY PROTEIN: postacrosomal sheath WW domain-binding protein [Panthera onca]